MSRRLARIRGPRAHARGQSMVEFVIILPVLLLLVLGIIQFAQIYIAKNTLDLAAYEGVRQGTLHNASAKWIDCGLAHGLMPLYGGSTAVSSTKAAWLTGECRVLAFGPTSTDFQRYAAAYSNAFYAIKPPPSALGGGTPAVKLDIVNPSTAAFAEFGVTGLSTKKEIPNDRLMWRSTAAGSSRENIQEANLLVIRVTYCYPMDVWFIRQVVQGLAIGAHKLIGTQSTFNTQCFVSGGVPLVAQSTMLMQSPAQQTIL